MLITHSSLYKCVPTDMYMLSSDKNYYLVLEDGRHGLFNFVSKAHKLISIGHLDVTEWHKAVKVIFKQLIECVDFMHNHNVCHFDISLENIVINDAKIVINKNSESNQKICIESKGIQIKLIDFGLAELFEDDFKTNKHCGKLSYFSPEIQANASIFEARSNDIWCCGIVLFAMIFDGFPWQRANESDNNFRCVVVNNDIDKLIEAYAKMDYVNQDLLDLFQGFFQYESKRITMQQIKDCGWLSY